MTIAPNFTTAVTPPDSDPEEAIAFAFKKDHLLIRLNAEQATVPTLGELADYPRAEQHYLGCCAEYGSCYALEIADDVTPLLRGRWQEHTSPFGWARQTNAGRVVYLQPGHEDCPVYAAPEIQKLLANAIRWVAPRL